MNEFQRDTVTDEMVLAALNERHRCLDATTPAPSLYYYTESAVDTMRQSLKAALAAARAARRDEVTR